MSAPSSAREALIVEALGEMAELLDRIDGVARALEAAAATATDASVRIESRASALEVGAVSLVDAAKQHLVRHVAAKTEDLARTAIDGQIATMAAEVHKLFRNELDSLWALRGASVDRPSRCQAIRRQWQSHAATAICASAITAALVTFLLST